MVQITSKNIKLKLEQGFDNQIIEQKLQEMGINPLRWAIVDVEENDFTISVACYDL